MSSVDPVSGTILSWLNANPNIVEHLKNVPLFQSEVSQFITDSTVLASWQAALATDTGLLAGDNASLTDAQNQLTIALGPPSADPLVISFLENQIRGLESFVAEDVRRVSIDQANIAVYQVPVQTDLGNIASTLSTVINKGTLTVDILSQVLTNLGITGLTTDQLQAIVDAYNSRY